MRNKHSLESVTALIAEHTITKRSELMKVNASAYQAARKNGWLDKLLPVAKKAAAKRKVMPAAKPKRAIKKKAERSPGLILEPLTINDNHELCMTVTFTGLSPEEVLKMEEKMKAVTI